MLSVIVGGAMRSMFSYYNLRNTYTQATIRNGRIIMDSSYVVLARRCTGIERYDAGWIYWWLQCLHLWFVKLHTGPTPLNIARGHRCVL